MNGGAFDIRQHYKDVKFDRSGVNITVPHNQFNIKKRIWDAEVQIEMWEKYDQDDKEKKLLYITGKIGLDSRRTHDGKKIQIYVTDPKIELGKEKQYLTIDKSKIFYEMINILGELLEKEKKFVENQLGDKFF